MTAHASFEKAYEALVETLKTNSRMEVKRAVQGCAEHYPCTNDNERERQVHLVADALWTNPYLANFFSLQAMLKPYARRPIQLQPTATLLNHPGLIRTCLALANFVDQSHRPIGDPDEEDITAFIMAIPGLQVSDTRDDLLPRVAQVLLGERWTTLCSLYDIPLEGVDGYRKALAELPTSILYLAATRPAADIEMPDQASP